MESEFEDDESNPIPYMDKIDVQVSTDKGAFYGIVIASPLSGSEWSQRRLLRKVEAYFGHIAAERLKWKKNHEIPMLARLRVAIHPDSDPVIFELLQRCETWAEENEVEFTVTTNLSKDVTH
jgi:hypothetical protein